MPGVQKRMATQPQQHGRSKWKMSFGNSSASERQGGKKVSEREGRAADGREGDMDEDEDDNDNDGEDEEEDDDDDEGANGVESDDENSIHFSQAKSAKTQSTS